MKYFLASFLLIFTSPLVFAAPNPHVDHQEQNWQNTQTTHNQTSNWQNTQKSNNQTANWQNTQGFNDQNNDNKEEISPNIKNSADKNKDDEDHDSESQEIKKKEVKNEDKGSASEDKKKEKKDKVPKPEKILKIGNLAFPQSQQPTPLISFGQNLIDEGQFDLQLVANELKGRGQYFIEFDTAIIYGIKNYLSIYINVPDAIRSRVGKQHSSGLKDTQIQFEYAAYTKENYTYYNQMTIVANVTIPTGSVKKNPPTGTGSNSFFIGGTFSRMGINWFYFTSYGGILNASSHRTQFGNQFLYQYGVGRRIFSNDSWLFDWMLEFDGTYTGKNKIEGVIDPNSGGNMIFVTPSLFLSSKEHLVIQLGIGFPIVQQLFGHQKREDYLLQTKISWNF